MIAWSDRNTVNGSTIGGVSPDIHIWDIQSQQAQFVLKGHSNTIMALAWQSEWIVSGGKDFTLRLWKTCSLSSALAWTSVAVIRDTIGIVTSLAWNPVVPLEFVCSGFDSSLCVWKVTEDDDRDEADVRLLWRLTDRLVAVGAKIKDTIGLDDMQRRLLRQGGAEDEDEEGEGGEGEIDEDPEDA